jgi:hypothetical protein
VGPLGQLLWTHGSDALNWNSLKNGPNATRTTIALVSAFALSSTFAFAKMVRHKPSVRTYDLHRGIPLGRSGFLHPNYGNPDGATSVSAGGLMWNGRSASEWGGG